MNPSDKHNRDRNKDTQAFDPPLIHEEEFEHLATGDEDKETEEEGESPEVEDQFLFMKKTRRRKAVRLPAMMTELMLSSFETIGRRSWMLSRGKCSPTEFARMVLEKQQALYLSGLALLSGASAPSILAPFHRGATANAKRLRRKRLT